VAQLLLAELDEPLMSSTLQLPGDELPLSDGAQIRAHLEHQLDLILDAGPCGVIPTTVIDLARSPPVVLRLGLGQMPGVLRAESTVVREEREAAASAREGLAAAG
jgi:tRNA A37 threonylcarbamoyladenosine synthetase subunit TsaC/SUA5/YrdC